jgi:hypothetical protein
VIKIPMLFVRDWNGNRALVTQEVTEGCEWVLAGEGRPTRKRDGTACLWLDGKLWKRYDAKAGRNAPAEFMPAQPDPDPETGHWPGWIPVGEGPEDRWHRDALSWGWWGQEGHTYELVGPKVGSNHDGYSEHVLFEHGYDDSGRPDNIALAREARTFTDVREALARLQYEGIVWWHPDGRMAKIKRRDLGLPWPVKGRL